VTKKDGDKLRKMRDDLFQMADAYERGSVTQHGMWKVAAALSAALAEGISEHKDKARAT
jgi:hypothetical protein